jgi:D-arabinose 1-dehydrogenase-like Zn-dependent alcohol dehydrogenase
MNTREEIINILSKNKKPLGPKTIALELKKSSANIRKILSNLCREGKIARVGFGKYILSVNVKNKSVNVLGKSVNVKSESVNVKTPEAKKLINREINKYRRTYFPEAYGKMRKAKNRYLRDWRVRNPDYNKKWLRAYYRKYPERVREYQRRYWLKKALSQAGS